MEHTIRPFGPQNTNKTVRALGLYISQPITLHKFGEHNLNYLLKICQKSVNLSHFGKCALNFKAKKSSQIFSRQ